MQERFELDKETYANWENDHCELSMRQWPGIVAFLGYDPNPESKTMGGQLLAHPRRHGLTRKALARQLGAGEATLWRWEAGQRKPERESHVRAIRLIELTIL
jgi:DNA-binding XRE family transcriptional regulator